MYPVPINLNILSLDFGYATSKYIGKFETASNIFSGRVYVRMRMNSKLSCLYTHMNRDICTRNYVSIISRRRNLADSILQLGYIMFG